MKSIRYRSTGRRSPQGTPRIGASPRSVQRLNQSRDLANARYYGNEPKSALPSQPPDVQMGDFGATWNTAFPDTMAGAPPDIQRSFVQNAPPDALAQFRRTMETPVGSLTGLTDIDLRGYADGGLVRGRGPGFASDAQRTLYDESYAGARVGGVGMGNMGTRYDEAFADGGLVQGPGTSTSDSILARLSKDEYVLPKESVELAGLSQLEQLRQDGLALRGQEASATAPRDEQGLMMLAQGTSWQEYLRRNTLTPDQLRQLKEGITRSAKASGNSPVVEMKSQNYQQAPKTSPYNPRTDPNLRNALKAPTTVPMLARVGGGLAMMAYPSPLGDGTLNSPEAKEIMARNDRQRAGLPEPETPPALPATYTDRRSGNPLPPMPENPLGSRRGWGAVGEDLSSKLSGRQTPEEEAARAKQTQESFAESRGNLGLKDLPKTELPAPSPSPAANAQAFGQRFKDRTSANPYSGMSDKELQDMLGNVESVLQSTGGILTPGTQAVQSYQALQSEMRQRNQQRPEGPAFQGVTRLEDLQRRAALPAQGQGQSTSGRPSMDQAVADAMDLMINGQRAKSYQGLKVWSTENDNAWDRQVRAQAAQALSALSPYYQGATKQEAERFELERARRLDALQQGVQQGDPAAIAAMRRMNAVSRTKESDKFRPVRIPGEKLSSPEQVRILNERTGRYIEDNDQGIPPPTTAQEQEILANARNPAVIAKANQEWGPDIVQAILDGTFGD